MRDARLTLGSWVKHRDGRTGAVQSYGWLRSNGKIAKFSREAALTKTNPQVLVDTGANFTVWWGYDEIECPIPAPAFTRVRHTGPPAESNVAQAFRRAFEGRSR